MNYSILLDVVGLEQKHLDSGLLPNISKVIEDGEVAKLEPTFPAVTSTVQSSILSGKYPRDHGIIANGLFDRSTFNVSFWEQSSSLVQAQRVWDQVKQTNAKKTAVLFWQNTMYANSDIVVTPRPIHLDDRMVMWCYSKPAGYYEKLKEKYGEFNLASYWGPLASPKSSEWIGSAAEYTLESERPNFLFVYIPHVDYSAQRFGTGTEQVRNDLKKADEIVGRLVQKSIDLGIRDETQFIILSEYAFNDVTGAVPLNLVLRDAGLLSVRTIQEKEYLDFEYSKAFAMVDHQVAHIYIKDGYEKETRKALETASGVDRILDSTGKKDLAIDHERSGELIVIAARDKWFSYYWWYEEDKAPDFARKVDIHRKPGYDPVELFIDPKTKSIPLDTSLVKGSHGRPVNLETQEGLAFYASSKKHGIISERGSARCVDIIKCLVDGQ
ncbi:MAG TPA: nucleotide pyrophosphatase/phosphodiesterase family protein [Nitrososphaera sp.]|nr:nucleotide pyrophosphatase/phosphodiesterase family protein [Nitrososphaera sp.]